MHAAASKQTHTHVMVSQDTSCRSHRRASIHAPYMHHVAWNTLTRYTTSITQQKQVLLFQYTAMH
jgi:hypothetical protein